MQIKNRFTEKVIKEIAGDTLVRANLREADLRGADLRGADLGIPSNILSAYWGACSDNLTLHLMRYDALNHPEPKVFLLWANGGSCPYTNLKISRSANFTEKRELIKRGFLSIVPKGAYELMNMLIVEHCKNKE